MVEVMLVEIAVNTLSLSFAVFVISITTTLRLVGKVLSFSKPLQINAYVMDI